MRSPAVLFFFLIFGSGISAQRVCAVVDSIVICGNDRTKSDIILREIDFGPGDTVAMENLTAFLERNALNLMNTGLFASADIDIAHWQKPDNLLTLKVNLKEAWYLFPVPLLELADRNFNVWWEEYNRDLRRLDYGLRFYHTNFTGRRDYFKLITQFGYTQKYSLTYNIPYINRPKTLGLAFDINYKRNHEVQYGTLGNKQQFLREDDRYMLDRFSATTGLNLRPSFKSFHYLFLGYRQNRVDATVATDLNPDFFGNGRRLQRFFSFQYLFIHENRNIQPFPTSGNRFELELLKEGLGVFKNLNTLRLTSGFTQYIPLTPKLSLEHQVKVRTALIRTKQPFYNSQALGFGTAFVRGYEFYVIDGIDFFLSRNSLRLELFNKNLDWGKWVPISAFRHMPIKVYLSGNADAGYVNNPYFKTNNQLSNKALFGTGVGLNFVIYYNKVFNFEYSFNAEGENGLFIHTSFGF